MRYKISLSYNGASFNGWQVQKNSPSVQEFINNALSKLLNKEINITGAGRTDTKVHASVYFAHFDYPSNIVQDTDFFLYKLNAILPKDIVIHNITMVNQDFNARFDADEREYKYFIHTKKDPFIKEYSYFYSYPINIEKIKEAVILLKGSHNCACFEKTGGSSNGHICDIYDAKWENYIPEHVRQLNFPGKEDNYFIFTIRANRFLRNMVRAIVGTLLDIGRGKHEPEWINYLFEKGNRSDAGESVPGHSLFLCDIHYPEK